MSKKSLCKKLSEAKVGVGPLMIIGVMTFLLSEVMSVLCIHSVSSGIIFALFIFLGVLTPGIAILYALGWKKTFDWEASGLSFVLGYCFSLFEYFSIMLLGLKDYVPIVVVVSATISVLFIYRQFRNVEINTSVVDNDICGTILILFFIVAMFTIAMVASCFNNLIQPIVYESCPAHDMLYWVGSIIELTKEFPPKDFFHYPNQFAYHYFSSAQLAFASLFTKIRPVHIGLCFSVVQSVLLRVLCGFVVVKKLTADKELQFLGMVLLFFSSGFERMTVITYMAHSYYSPFGTEYGLSIFLVFLYLMVVKLEEDKNRIRTSILVWICMFVLAGEKIAYGGIALLGLGVVCVGLMVRKDYQKAFMTGLPALGIFIVEYFTMMHMSGYVDNANGNGDRLGLSPIWERWPEFTELYDRIGNWVSYTHLPIGPFFFMAFCAIGSPVCFVIVVYNIYNLKKSRKWSVFDFSLLSMYLAGFLVMIFVQMFALSNMYFAFVSFPVAIVWLMNRGFPSKMLGRLVLLMASIISIGGFVKGYSSSILDYIKSGTNLFMSGMPDESRYREDSYVSHEEYEAYEWIRENSTDNCMIATNRISRAVGVLTERYINNPDSDNSFYTKTTDKEREEALQDYQSTGVEYIIYEAKYGEKPEYLENTCDKAWQTEDIIIYAVQ